VRARSKRHPYGGSRIVHEADDGAGAGAYGRPMPISVGGSVPPIQVPAYVRGRRNARVAGPGHERGRWVVLSFYPRDFSSACLPGLAELAELAELFDREQATVMAVSTGSWLSHRRWFDHHPALASVRYPVLADTAYELAGTFGTLEEDGCCRPATFLIDPQGIVCHVIDGRDEAEDAPLETLRVLQDLRTPGWRALIAA
jgi:peroxiredoxin (alkyl hydroperoxide reductase subunit C)